MKEIIIGLIAVMIWYDFSLHIFDWLNHEKSNKIKHPFGMYLVMNYFGFKNNKKRQHVYDIFWTFYWGSAAVLILIYIILVYFRAS